MGSVVPIYSVGTPKQRALRRDFSNQGNVPYIGGLPAIVDSEESRRVLDNHCNRPDNLQGWLNLIRASITTNNPATAESKINEALRDGYPPVELHSVSAQYYRFGGYHEPAIWHYGIAFRCGYDNPDARKYVNETRLKVNTAAKKVAGSSRPKLRVVTND